MLKIPYQHNEEIGNILILYKNKFSPGSSVATHGRCKASDHLTIASGRVG